MKTMLNNRLKKRFHNRFNMKPLSNGYHYRADYTARDFKASCGVTLAKFEELKHRS